MDNCVPELRAPLGGCACDLGDQKKRGAFVEVTTQTPLISTKGYSRGCTDMTLLLLFFLPYSLAFPTLGCLLGSLFPGACQLPLLHSETFTDGDQFGVWSTRKNSLKPTH